MVDGKRPMADVKCVIYAIAFKSAMGIDKLEPLATQRFSLV